MRYLLLQSYNSDTECAPADVPDSPWNYLAGAIMPIAARLAIILLRGDSFPPETIRD